MLSKENRLTRSRSIKYILRKGQKIYTEYFTLFFVGVRNEKELRIAFIASKKVGNAVQRNRAVRVLKESARLLLKEKSLSGVHMVVIAKNEILNTSFQDVYMQMSRVFEKVKGGSK